MKSVRYQPVEGQPIVVVDQPVRQTGADDVVVRILAASVGPFDLGGTSWAPSVSIRTPGVGAIGIVDEIGSEVSRVRVGDRVAVDTVIRCLRCNACLADDAEECTDPILAGISADVPGTMAELICLPQDNVHPIGAAAGPEGVLLPYAAWSFRALRVSGFLAGDTVVVVGAGLLGAMTVLVAEALGATSVTLVDDRDDVRSALVDGPRRFGFTTADVPIFNSEQAPWTPDGPELVACTVGDRAALRTSLGIAGARTSIVLLDLAPGAAIEVGDYIPELLSKEARLEAFASTSRDDFRRVTQLWLSGVLDLGALPLRPTSLDELATVAEHMSSAEPLPYRYLDLASTPLNETEEVAS